MGKPYSDLEKRALAILANNGNPASSQDAEVANYWKWKINPSLDSHTLDEGSTRPRGRKLLDVAINPFGINMAANTFAKATISDRANDFLDADIKSALKFKTLAANDTVYRLGRFTPARVYFRLGAATATRTETSRITRRKYKTHYQKTDQGYTAPFGQSAEADTVFARQTQIKTAIKSKFESANLITFSPEKVRP